MGEVAYPDEDYWTKGSRLAGDVSGTASAAWANANSTDPKLILLAWNEVNKAALNQVSKVLVDLHADHRQLRMELAHLRAQLASQEMHRAVAEYGSLMRNRPPLHQRIEVIVAEDDPTVRARTILSEARRQRLLYTLQLAHRETIQSAADSNAKHEKLQGTLTDHRDEAEYPGVRALRPFRDATGAALLGAVVSGLLLGWAGDKQTIELIGASVGVIAYVIARSTSVYAKSKSHS